MLITLPHYLEEFIQKDGNYLTPINIKQNLDMVEELMQEEKNHLVKELINLLFKNILQALETQVAKEVTIIQLREVYLLIRRQ